VSADPQQPLNFAELTIGQIDAVVVLASALVRAGVISREALAQAYTEAERQQASQPLSGAARQLAVHTVGSFFAAPLLDGKPKLQLVVDNDRSKTAP
jgi:hypothetical protein